MWFCSISYLTTMRRSPTFFLSREQLQVSALLRVPDFISPVSNSFTGAAAAGINQLIKPAVVR
jgi:hypothetical protein